MDFLINFLDRAENTEILKRFGHGIGGFAGMKVGSGLFQFNVFVHLLQSFAVAGHKLDVIVRLWHLNKTVALSRFSCPSLMHVSHMDWYRPPAVLFVF